MLDQFISFINEGHLKSTLDGSLDGVYCREDYLYFKAPDGKEKKIGVSGDFVAAQLPDGRLLYYTDRPESKGFLAKILQLNSIILADPSVPDEQIRGKDCFPDGDHALLYIENGTVRRLSADAKEEELFRTGDPEAEIESCDPSQKTLVIRRYRDKRIVYQAFYSFGGELLEAPTRKALRKSIAEYIIRSVIDDVKYYDLVFPDKRTKKPQKACVETYHNFDPDNDLYGGLRSATETFVKGGIAYSRRSTNLLRALGVLEKIGVGEEDLPFVLYGFFGRREFIRDSILKKAEKILASDLAPEEKIARVSKIRG